MTTYPNLDNDDSGFRVIFTLAPSVRRRPSFLWQRFKADDSDRSVEHTAGPKCLVNSWSRIYALKSSIFEILGIIHRLYDQSMHHEGRNDTLEGDERKARRQGSSVP